jgi:spore coat protein JB
MPENNTTNNNCNCNSSIQKQDMLEQIKSVDFAIEELALYLDTHPDDNKAICLHNNYCNQMKDLKDMYQKMYGPLSIYCPCNMWKWIEEPWPWEGEN